MPIMCLRVHDTLHIFCRPVTQKCTTDAQPKFVHCRPIYETSDLGLSGRHAWSNLWQLHICVTSLRKTNTNFQYICHLTEVIWQSCRRLHITLI